MYMPVNAFKMEASLVPYVLIAKFFKVKKILERTYSKCEETFITCPDEKKTTKHQPITIANLLNLN